LQTRNDVIVIYQLNFALQKVSSHILKDDPDFLIVFLGLLTFDPRRMVGEIMRLSCKPEIASSRFFLSGDMYKLMLTEPERAIPVLYLLCIDLHLKPFQSSSNFYFGWKKAAVTYFSGIYGNTHFKITHFSSCK